MGRVKRTGNLGLMMNQTHEIWAGGENGSKGPNHQEGIADVDRTIGIIRDSKNCNHMKQEYSVSARKSLTSLRKSL